MARLPALIETLGQHHPRGAVGVENYARILRKAGKITPSKRGVGAANVTVSDASNLLFGLAEMNNAAFAPVAADMLRGALRLAPWEGEPDPLDVLANFDMNLNFAKLGELLDSILVQIAVMDPMPKEEGGNRFITSIDLRIQSPSIHGCKADVVFTVMGARRDHARPSRVTVTYFAEHPDSPPFDMDQCRSAEDMANYFRAIENHPQVNSGISFDINISCPVLQAVADCVLAETPDTS